MVQCFSRLGALRFALLQASLAQYTQQASKTTHSSPLSLLLPDYQPFQTTLRQSSSAIVQRQLDAAFDTCMGVGRKACGDSCIPETARCCDTVLGDFCDSEYYCMNSGCCLDGRDCGAQPTPLCLDADSSSCPLALGCCPRERPTCIIREDGSAVCHAESASSATPSVNEGSARTVADSPNGEDVVENNATSTSNPPEPNPDGSTDMVILVTSSPTDSNTIQPPSTTASNSRRVTVSATLSSVTATVFLYLFVLIC
ncbi:hypothetical protein BJ508DRAFT_410876 [Ascobolus immersus RN42]|uniref:Disintegrin domain-containing protein n=1 Tax=Ascobolus immersus RN42 TaxID=1160509 RepID=A0A3N4IPM0_ASCIM|nr:hypothetical protein BJ508DRAFT_410876 [Ascobolus immersus RN42]